MRARFQESPAQVPHTPRRQRVVKLGVSCRGKISTGADWRLSLVWRSVLAFCFSLHVAAPSDCDVDWSAGTRREAVRR
jgi:hypothetical protein